MSDLNNLATHRYLTAPNGISILRLLVGGYFVWLTASRHQSTWLFVVIVTVGLSDKLDGFVARKWHQRSRFGELLDPSVDRLVMLLLGLCLWRYHNISSAFAVALCAREALQITLGLCYALSSRPFPRVSRLGKLAMGVQIGSLAGLVLTEGRSEALYIISAVGFGLSFFWALCVTYDYWDQFRE